jgi:hypothetical protein
MTLSSLACPIAGEAAALRLQAAFVTAGSDRLVIGLAAINENATRPATARKRRPQKCLAAGRSRFR